MSAMENIEGTVIIVDPSLSRGWRVYVKTKFGELPVYEEQVKLRLAVGDRVKGDIIAFPNSLLFSVKQVAVFKEVENEEE